MPKKTNELGQRRKKGADKPFFHAVGLHKCVSNLLLMLRSKYSCDCRSFCFV